jgi:glycolate oxidase subunit GlcD
MRLNRRVVEKIREIVGEKNVLSDKASLTCYSIDFFPGKTCKPDLVVKPQEVKQIVRIVRLANLEKFPVIPRGAGTSVTGGVVPVKGGVILDLVDMDHILDFDVDNLQVTVEAGVVWDKLNKFLGKKGFFFPSTPGSASVSTVGGSLSVSGSGMRSIKYGTVRSNTLKIEVVLPNGSLIRAGSKTLKTSCGYNLKDLFIGSEGTLGIIVKAVLRVYPIPESSLILYAEFNSLKSLNKTLCEVLKSGIVPSAMEFSDKTALKYVEETEKPKNVEADLLIELTGRKISVEADSAKVLEILRENSALKVEVIDSAQKQREEWKKRSELYFRLVRTEPTPIAEDLAVPISRIAETLKFIRVTARQSKVKVAVLGHADGTLHMVIMENLKNKKTYKQTLRFRSEVYRFVAGIEGTITSEHGLGFYRVPFAHFQLSSTYTKTMKKIKKILDPNNIMNPGKMGL